MMDLIHSIKSFLMQTQEVKIWEIAIVGLFFVAHWIFDFLDHFEKEKLRSRIRELESNTQ